MAWAWLRAPFNSLAFALRERLALSRGRPEIQSECKDGLFSFLADEERPDAEAWEARLCERHGLAEFRTRSTLLDYRESLVTLDALDRLVGDLDLAKDEIRALDVGAGAWNYACGLAAFLEGRGRRPTPRRLELVGLEVDGHGVYPDFRSRADHAASRAAQAGPGVQYVLGDVRSAGLQSFDVVSLFYPFLGKQALLAWGLPLSLLDPAAVLQAAVRALRPGGQLWVFNQSAEEADQVQEFLHPLPVTVLRSMPLESRYVPYRESTEDRRGLLAVKAKENDPKNVD